ncbi:MAG TPA: glycosyltransferase [Thermoanaerobaculia bacterium]|nr:glycosyltransferase [Thermoanaerobaculia bacterium]
MSPPFQLPDVDCVVVNRDGGDPFFQALSSVRSQAGVDASMIVVDNASRPAEREKIARDFPEVRLVTFPRNLGFAGGANEGIARGRSPFVLLVNNDAVLSPDYAARLAARLALDDRLAAVQGLVLTSDGRRVDSAGLSWNRRGEAVPVLAGAAPAEAPADVFEVSGVSATATLYRRAALRSVAPHGEVFDRSFFAYYEDVDLSLRLSRAGWRFACDPAAACRHEGSRTGRRTPARRALWTARNRWRTLFRNFDSRLLARSFFALLRADLAHVRQLGWKGALLPVLVWPRLPVLAWRARQQSALLSDWPRAIGP